MAGVVIGAAILLFIREPVRGGMSENKGSSTVNQDDDHYEEEEDTPRTPLAATQEMNMYGSDQPK